MPNTELLRLTKEATSAFNAYKSALRQKGHKISGEINLAELTGLSGWEEQLKRDWLAAVKKCEAEAGCPAQGSLDMDTGPEKVANPLDLHINHAYRHVESGLEYLFRGYNAGEDLYTFWHNEGGGMRGATSWVREAFDLANAPEFDPTIPTEDPAITQAIEYAEEDGGRYVVKRVGPERFQELVNVESSAGLRKKSPTAKSIEMIADVSYVVTKAVDLDDPEAAKVYLTPCAPAAKDEKGEGFFKCGKDRWKIAGEPIIIKIAPVVELTETPDPGDMNQADPLEWVKNMVERGFTEELDGEKVVYLAPRSFAALRAQVSPDLEGEVDTLYVGALDMNVLLRADGMEIDGWEEPKAEEPVAESPALEVVEGGPEGEASAESAVPSAESAPATAAQEAPATTADAKKPSPTDEEADAEVPKGENRIIDYEKAAGDVNKWDMQFDDEHEGVPTHVSVKFGYTESHDLFCIVWTEKPTASYEPVAWVCDSAHVSGTKQGMGDFAKALCATTLELRLSE